MAFQDQIVLDDLQQRIFDELARMPIIDAHEHLKSEPEFLATEYDWCWLLQYVINDLHSAGLDGAFSIYDRNLSPAEKWARIKPYWRAVRWGNTARMFRLSLQEWFGISDIDEDAIEVLGRKLKENTRPGFYRAALTDKCRVERVITNGRDWRDYDHDFLRVIVNIPQVGRPAELQAFGRRMNFPLRNLEQLREALAKYFRDAIAAEVVGFKTLAYPLPKCAEPRAQALLDTLVAERRLSFKEWQQFNSFVHELSFEIIRRTGKVLAVHCGCRADYHFADTENFYDAMLRFPEIRFDLFHMGLPLPRVTATVGRAAPNATLNLNGAALFSAHMAEHALQEFIDLVPMNKIIGFGGDYQWRPELVWGHLQVVREGYARAFAARIRRGLIDFDGAVETLKQWMYDNPRNCYRI